MILGTVGDIQQPPDLLLTNVRPRTTSRQGSISELKIMHWLVVLQSTDQIVTVELPGI